MWIWIVVIAVAIIIAASITGRPKQTTDSADDYYNHEDTMTFEERVKNLSNQMVHDMHSGCTYSGCCVYDMSNTSDEDWDDEVDKKVCYCQYLEKHVQRQKSCAHFKDRKPYR